ncbi:MAG TPA: bifunctional 4-hydroxy-2-oxoglutarate aldolase/2-dehydro-3-deoxy-phosphogluconate aldolase [Vicinamibacterales bacterium]|nr:bifunctional 4-hydroxy-2-oxoglutarate aldolase/2-dehydro-3-deoxy-phosphogluconate aldolase [Vicinamibacterales bacterium]
MNDSRSAVLARLTGIGVIPVVRAASADEALAAVAAIEAGGLPVLEITMTVPGAIGVIEAVTARYGDTVLVGAGTVLDPETARDCVAAGARFIVSPAVNVRTIEWCRGADVPVMPGALTPTEVLTAWQAGADFVKVFPCDSAGGAAHIKALKGPFPQIPLIPTGGVTLVTVADYIRAGAAAVGVGSNLVDTKAIAAGDAGRVTEAARQYVEAVRQARGAP